MSLLFNVLFGFVIALLPKSKHLLISWLKPPPAVILEPKKVKILTVSTVSPSAMMWWDHMPWSLFFECWVSSQLFHSLLLYWCSFQYNLILGKTNPSLLLFQKFRILYSLFFQMSLESFLSDSIQNHVNIYW